MKRILLIEDNPGDALLIEESLKRSSDDAYTIKHVVRVADAVNLLKAKHRFDIVISDLSLPDAQGIETVKAINKATKKTPVIYMTGTNHDSELALAAIQQGAQDYVAKSKYTAESLSRIIKFAIERKKYQEQVAQARAKTKKLRTLTQMLKVRTEELIMLNQAKDDFISLASHQLRTPASGVKQYVGMVLEGYAGELDPETKELLQLAYESNERQLAIVNDLLHVAQLDAGKVRLNKENVNITEMLHNIVNEQLGKFHSREQALTYDMVSKDIEAYVDPQRMRMVIENIIDNANKYTDDGKKVTVAVHETKQQIIVAVEDQGVGIAPADIPHIFQKFNRVSNTRSVLAGGSGLGMYWAKQIIDLHNGNLKVESEVGVGSKFIISLPKN